MNRNPLPVLALALLLSAPSRAEPGFERAVDSAVSECAAASERALAPKPAAVELRVLSYNIQGLPNDDDAFHERYAKIGKKLYERRQDGTAPQLVAIQEAFHPRTDELVAESGYPYYRYGARGTSHSPLPSGLIILSEYPIESAATVDFARCVGWDCWANKGAVLARVRVPGLPAPLELIDTHMNAGRDDAELAIRRSQVVELLDFMRARRVPGAPYIFPGDFNFRRGEIDYAEFSAGAGSNAAESCLARHGQCAGDDAAMLLREVDHQFFGSSDRVSLRPIRAEQSFKELEDGRPLSDHRGLEVVFRIEVAPSGPATAAAR